MRFSRSDVKEDPSAAQEIVQLLSAQSALGVGVEPLWVTMVGQPVVDVQPLYLSLAHVECRPESLRIDFWRDT